MGGLLVVDLYVSEDDIFAKRPWYGWAAAFTWPVMFPAIMAYGAVQEFFSGK